MRFSWKAVLLAPLLAPVLFDALFGPLLGFGPGDGIGPALALFAVLLVPACIISYATTVFVFLPCLALLSRWIPMTYVRVCLLGLVLGAAVVVPVTWFEWKSSGPDSGPPVESFAAFFVRWASDPSFWVNDAVVPVAGLLTAGFYWWLATRRPTEALRAGV